MIDDAQVENVVYNFETESLECLECDCSLKTPFTKYNSEVSIDFRNVHKDCWKRKKGRKEREGREESKKDRPIAERGSAFNNRYKTYKTQVGYY